MKYIQHGDTITRIYENKELERIIEISAYIIYDLVGKRCPIKVKNIHDHIIDTCISGDICHGKCDETEECKISCWEAYLYNELYWESSLEDDEEGDED